VKSSAELPGFIVENEGVFTIDPSKLKSPEDYKKAMELLQEFAKKMNNNL
jgi:hypothetical protein